MNFRSGIEEALATQETNEDDPRNFMNRTEAVLSCPGASSTVLPCAVKSTAVSNNPGASSAVLHYAVKSTAVSSNPGPSTILPYAVK